MAMNNVSMLGDYMFEEMERLNNFDLEENPDQLEALETEIKRAKAMGDIAREITNNNRTALQAAQFQADYGGVRVNVPKMLRG